MYGIISVRIFDEHSVSRQALNITLCSPPPTLLLRAWNISQAINFNQEVP